MSMGQRHSTNRRIRAAAGASVLLVAVLAAACSSTPSSSPAPSTTPTTIGTPSARSTTTFPTGSTTTRATTTTIKSTTTTTKKVVPPTTQPATTTQPTTTTTSAVTTSCDAPAGWHSVTASPVASSKTDYDLTSFDGTIIRIHWFPNAKASTTSPLPTILYGPGWGSAGDTDPNSPGTLGATTIGQLWAAGYNVLTWDPRGFGASGGTAEVDSPVVEGKDISSIISWVARQNGVALKKPGVPRIGMVGASYGGGIQLSSAATDCRIDAIAPIAAWNSLVSSLFLNQTAKIGWGGILYEAAAGHSIAPQLGAAFNQSQSSGTITRGVFSFFASRGPSQVVSKIHAPTLLIQGTVDDLFTLNQAVANYRILKAHGTTTSMAWFCGGHGVCFTNPGTINPSTLSIDWMNRYVKGNTSAPALKGFEFVDQNGTVYHAASYPPAPGPAVVSTGSGMLSLTSASKSGPSTATPNAQEANVVDVVALGVTPAPAKVAINVPIAFPKSAVALGAPRLTITYAGTSPAGTRPTRVFAQLVDPSTGLVVNNQITPIPVVLDGRTHTISLPLELIGYTAKADTTLRLQLVATTVAYSQPRLGGQVGFSKIRLVVPTAKGLSIISTSKG